MQPLSLITIIAALTLSKAATIHRPPAGFLESNPQLSIRDDAFFITFQGEAGTPQAKSDHDTFRAALKKLNIKVKERQEFTQLINAISLEVAASEIGKISAVKAVKDVFPMVVHTPPRLIRKDIKNPALKFSHGITGVAEIHDTLGYFGKGIKVGVIDSGIDFKHPALGECFGPGCKVAYGYDFVGDAYDGTNTPVPGGEPRDHCNGHGTHVAGIIAAKDKDFTGVAPEVTLGAYRVFGCHGSTENDIIIAAMERAYMDGMDIINLSLGGGSSWAEYPDALVADKLADKGMLVVAAMGNEGDRGMWQASSPGMASKGIAVASYDNVRYMAYGFKVDGEDSTLFDYQPADDTAVFKLEHIDVASAKAEGGDDLACKALPADSLKGKVALIRRGDCTFNEKAKFAQDAGAAAVLIYNKEVGAITPSITDKEIKIPVAGVKQDTGNKLVGLLAKAPVKITFGQEKVAFDNPTGGKVSDFSSWGPGPELEMKPDLGAPGGLIYSTYPLDMGAYATLSGTSMATPYTAGSAALYLQAKGKRPPVEVRDTFKVNAMQTTNLGTDNLTPVSRQGAGLINVKNAIESTTVVSPASIRLASSDVKTSKMHHIVVKNTGDVTMRYELTHKAALAVKPWEDDGEISGKPEQKAASANVKIETPKFTLSPGQSRSVVVFFTEPQDLSKEEKWLYGGFITVTPRLPVAQENAGKMKRPTPMSIPYGGFRGNYKKVPILSRNNFPIVYDPATSTTMKEGRQFSLKGGDMPTLVLRLLHPCKSLQLRIMDNNERDLGFIAGGDNKLTGRNDATPDNLFFQTQWNGKVFSDGGSDTSAAPAPDGTYKFVIKAQMPLDKKFDEWVSPSFAIDRSLNSTVSSNATVPLGKQLTNWVRKRVPSREHGIEHLSDNSVLPKPITFVKKTQ